jgi:hypothetical protein
MHGVRGIRSTSIEPNEIIIGSPSIRISTDRAVDEESASGSLRVVGVKG